MLLQAGSTDVQKLMAGDADGKKFAKIVVGTSDTPVSDTDSALTNPVIKDIESVNYFDDGHVQFNATLASGDPAMTVAEMGLMNDSGVLVYRKVVTPVNKVAGVTYSLQYKIKVQ